MSVRTFHGRNTVRVALERGLSIGLILSALTLSGCGYYGHLIRGHSALMRDRVPVDEVIANPATPDAIRHKLVLSVPLRQFAQTELQLPVKGAYSEYVRLERDWATWNLFAAPPLSMTPKQWCYPVVGCANYRGYFDQQRAQRDAEGLREDGLEVYAGGAIAYSTLGWFDDPLTTPMLSGSDAWVAELLFHELVHRRFYLKGDTRFNESLATAVAREGVRRWLEAGGVAESAHTADEPMSEKTPELVSKKMSGQTPEQRRQQVREDERLRVQRRDVARGQVLALVEDARDQLTALYQSPLPDSDKIARRDDIRAQLRRAFATALNNNADLAGYQDWFAGPLNNAQLNTLADYEGWVTSFAAILSDCAGQWSCFWQEVERIAALSAEQRVAALQVYAASSDEESRNEELYREGQHEGQHEGRHEEQRDATQHQP